MIGRLCIGLFALGMSLDVFCQTDPGVIKLARQGNVPERFVRYSTDYLPRINFNARLVPATGIIHRAGRRLGCGHPGCRLSSKETQ